MGEITFAIPQVRDGGFYPSALEKGLRSERAIWAADLVIVPTATEFASLDSLAKTFLTFQTLRDKKNW